MRTNAQSPTLPARAAQLGWLAAAMRAGLAALVLFHVWLLGRRLGDGSFDTTILARWLGAAVVVALFIWVGRIARHQGRRNRRADLVLWSLVLLIHSGGTAPLTPAGDALQTLPLAELGALVLPLSLVSWTLSLWQVSLLLTTLRTSILTTRAAALQPAGLRLDFRLFSRPPPANSLFLG